MSPSSRSGVAPATPPQATGHRSSAWGAHERGPSSACTGLLSLAQARLKAQGLQANRPCNTSGRRHPAKLRHSQCSFYATFIACFTPFGTQFPSASHRETVSHFGAEFWDALSVPGLYRKMRPILRLDSGTQFPSASQREIVSHPEHLFRDALRYLRSNISANEISLVPPLLAAAS